MPTWQVPTELLDDDAFAKLLSHGSASSLCIAARAERDARIAAEKALAEVRRQVEASGRVYGMVQQASAEIVRHWLKMRKALRPFAEAAEAWRGYHDAEWLVDSWPGANDGQLKLTVGDLRAAQEAFDANTHDKET